jgi:hypothetical protein
MYGELSPNMLPVGISANPSYSPSYISPILICASKAKEATTAFINKMTKINPASVVSPMAKEIPAAINKTQIRGLRN